MQVPKTLKQEPIWSFETYPKVLLLFDPAWEDREKLLRDTRGHEIARPLIRSANPHLSKGGDSIQISQTDRR